jgi:aspartyl-tRNA(Asn)/glutamyl-tRNA(Gln) amidotransferase subunit C
MQLDVVKKLANLARIDMSDEEMNEIAKDFDSILAYIGQVQEAASANPNVEIVNKNIDSYPIYNVMREDVVTNQEGEFTDKILGQAPNTENGFLKVKQIL